MKINPKQVEALKSQLQTAKNKGVSLNQAVLDLHRAVSTKANAVNAMAAFITPKAAFVIHSPAELGFAAKAVYAEEATPLSVAILAKDIYDDANDVVETVLGAFPNYTATEMGNLLLNEQLYPNMTSPEMLSALTEDGQYTNEEAQIAVNAIFGAKPVDVNASFVNPTIKETNCQVQTGPSTFFNSAYKRSWLMHAPGRSYIKFEYAHQKSAFSTVNLVMVHLTSMAGPKAGFSPIDIMVNGQTFKSKYNVGNGNYKKDTFNITSLVQEGANLIQLDFCNGASTNYWIQSMEVDYIK